MNAEKVKERIYSIDLLRGVVMMLMLLDHTRDFVHHGSLSIDPTDLNRTNVALFLTRWITHFCAPAFVFLSGISIYLQKLNGKPNAELSRFLLTRGLWLVLLEFTVVRFGLVFNFDYSFFGMAQVIWVIGVSMIVMAGLIYLPVKLTGLLALAMIVLHNLLDRFQLSPDVAFSGNADVGQSVWMIFHQMGVVSLGSSGMSIFFAYPLIPWVGVMALGWALGSIYTWEAGRRKKLLLAGGIAATVLFVVVRATKFYGDPAPWSMQSSPSFSVLSFLNTTKYPPSLLFLLMTLGPATIVLALTDAIDGRAIWQRVAIIFGRVPMFFYILQWFTAHGMGIVLSLLAGKSIGYFFLNFGANGEAAPADYGFSLPIVYAAWIAGLLILFPLCWWYGNYKRRNKHWLLSYL